MFLVGMNRRNQANHRRTIHTCQKQKNYRAPTIPNTKKGRGKDNTQHTSQTRNVEENEKSTPKI
jgi:hypothetical protein